MDEDDLLIDRLNLSKDAGGMDLLLGRRGRPVPLEVALCGMGFDRLDEGLDGEDDGHFDPRAVGHLGRGDNLQGWEAAEH